MRLWNVLDFLRRHHPHCSEWHSLFRALFSPLMAECVPSLAGLSTCVAEWLLCSGLAIS